MSDFVTEQQFLRARKILRKLMYQNTYSEKKELPDLGIYNYDDRNEVIGVEGHKQLKINIPRFSVNEGDIKKVKSLNEFKEADTLYVTERGFQITLRPEDE